MDNRLVLAVVLVTLSWLSMGTYAQNTTMAPNTTMANMTMANATMAPNATVVNATMAPNATMVNATMAPNATVAADTTMAPNVTTAPPLTPNTTVETLQTNISNAGCGTEVLCASQPASCDPSGGQCFFLGAKQQSGNNFEFQLAGESDGYLAATLSTDTTLGGNDTTYVCANNNGSVQFFGAFLDNGVLTKQELNVNTVKGMVKGTLIQCTFAATVPSQRTRASSFALAVSTGAFNSSSGTLGAPTSQIKTAVVDLTNANATVTNELSTNATTSPNTTSHAITLQQSLTQALLISAGVMGLAFL